MKSKVVVITSLLAASAALFAAPAMAGGVHWSVNVGVPAYPVAPVVAPMAPVVTPMPPTVAYVSPPPVVYAPPPRVVYGPPPAYYYGPGVGVVGYGPYYGRPHWHHPHHGDWR